MEVTIVRETEENRPGAIDARAALAVARRWLALGSVVRRCQLRFQCRL